MPHVFVGPHPDTLADGRPVGLDQVIHDLDLTEPHNQRLIEKGWLLEHHEPATTSTDGEGDTPPEQPKPRPRRRTTTDQEASQ